MLHPMRQLLGAVDRWLPPVLVPEPWRWRIHELAGQLPAAFHWALLECRLTRDDPRVDFSVCASVAEGGRERLATLTPHEAAPAWLDATRCFAEAWARADSPFGDLPSIGLEYDLPSEGGTRGPSVFVCTEPSFPLMGPTPMAPSRMKEWLARGLSLLAARRIEPATLDAVERCARCLPEDGRILHVASMPERGTRGLRVCAVMSSASIPGWLEAIGWPGEFQRVEQALEPCGPLSWMGLNIEVSQTVEPYFAIEQVIHGNADACRKVAGRLVRLGMADPVKAEAAARWLGDETVDLPGVDWHVNIQRQLYFKIIPHPDGRMEAKAYLGIAPRFSLF